jgi:hypothetical protein
MWLRQEIQALPRGAGCRVALSAVAAAVPTQALQQACNSLHSFGRFSILAIRDVMCVGMRFPGQWKNLGGLRVSPYTCDFGAKWLQIHAAVRITNRRGQAFETITAEAMKNATNVSETNLNWKWTTECTPRSIPGWCP